MSHFGNFAVGVNIKTELEIMMTGLANVSNITAALILICLFYQKHIYQKTTNAVVEFYSSNQWITVTEL